MRQGGLHVRYMTGYANWLCHTLKHYMARPGAAIEHIPTLAVLTSDGRIAIVVEAMFALEAVALDVDAVCCVGSVTLDDRPAEPDLAGELAQAEALFRKSPAGPPSAADALRAWLDQCGLDGAIVGLDHQGLGPHLLHTLQTALPRVQWRDCTAMMLMIRMVKTPAEIALMQRATEIGEAALHEALAAARPGTPLMQIIARYRAALGRQAADYDHLAFAPRGLGITMNSKTTVQPHDVMYVDFGCVYEGYCSDAGVTFASGRLDGDLQHKYDALRDAVAQTAAALRPGMLASQVFANVNGAITARGVQGAWGEGHGLGMEVRDYPVFAPDTALHVKDDCINVPADLPLEAGMVVNLETPIYAPPHMSLHVERTFIVTPTGGRPLAHQDRDRPVICGDDN